MDEIKNGPGLKKLSDEVWWGPGYCGICGDTDEKQVVPRAVRWWDPDEGWKMGVLCKGCIKMARNEGPHPDDFAYYKVYKKDLIDTAVDAADLDGAYVEI